MDRTLAAIDRAWLAWIASQLEHVLSSRVRLIPDCLLLSLPGDALASDLVAASSPALMSVREGDALVYCQRTGIQTGIAWAEYCAPGAQQHTNASHDHRSSKALPLPSQLGSMNAIPLSWVWAAPSAIAFLAANASSRAPNFALNLLPAGFKSRSGVNMPTSPSAGGTRTLRGATTLAWADPLTWQPALRWLGLGIAAIALGFIAHLALLCVSIWRWGQQMELLAMQSLSPASMAKLSSGAKEHAVLPVFLDQALSAQRSQGAVTDADFASLAAKLQQLSNALQVQSLQQIQYSANAVEFEFKAGVPNYSSNEAVLRVIATARNSGLLVTHLGGTRYRLEAFAGLGARP
jgi:hypothetical protein